MTQDETENGTGSKHGAAPAEPEILVWLAATVEDFRGVAFEAPIAECNSADCRDYTGLFDKAVEIHEKLADEAAEPAVRVYSMLSAISNFTFNPKRGDRCYGPMLEMEGRRSAIPEDFRGQPVEVLAYAADVSNNPVLKARLDDVCWILERSRYENGLAAVAGYVATIEGLEAGILTDQSAGEDPLLGLAAASALRRANYIGTSIGGDHAVVASAQEWARELSERALAVGNPIAIRTYFEIGLDFRVLEPELVAVELEQFAGGNRADASLHSIVELWRLAARAWQIANNSDGEFRCKSAAAELFAANAEKVLKERNSAILASHWLATAIAEYGGVPNKRERRAELRQQLIDVQGAISDEMQSFSHEVDTRKISEAVEKKFGNEDLLTQLLYFASLEQSPDPEKLAEKALKTVTENPLSSLLSTTFHDSEGKVTHRTEGAGLRYGELNGAVANQMVKDEEIRRLLVANTQVLVAKRHISHRHYVGEDVFRAMLRFSPFVPQDLIGTFSRGFTRFFEGDAISALYILTPLLENSLRHVLKQHGYDVSTLDDGTQTQEDRTITSLFSQMRPELDQVFGKAITTDIEHVFLAKPGPIIRHAVAHGFLSDGSPYSPDAVYACWLIYRICCIPLFSIAERIELPA